MDGGTPLTDAEEIALALLLWRALRGEFGRTGNLLALAVENIEVNGRTEALAIKCGVREEFYKLLVELPVLEVKCKSLDGTRAMYAPKKRQIAKWKRRKPS